MSRFQGANQDSAGRAFFLADKIHAPVNAVRAIDVEKARRAEHHHVARRRAVKGMGRRFGMVIGLDLDDQSADTVDE